jgi:hypothetical protein
MKLLVTIVADWEPGTSFMTKHVSILELIARLYFFMLCCTSNGIHIYHYAYRKVIPIVAIPVEYLWNYVYQKLLILVP